MISKQIDFSEDDIDCRYHKAVSNGDIKTASRLGERLLRREISRYLHESNKGMVPEMTKGMEASLGLMWAYRDDYFRFKLNQPEDKE